MSKFLHNNNADVCNKASNNNTAITIIHHVTSRPAQLKGKVTYLVRAPIMNTLPTEEVTTWCHRAVFSLLQT